MSRCKRALSDTEQQSLNLSGKLAATAGSFSALYLLPMVAQGAVVTASNLGVNLAFGQTGPVTWNVDGLGHTFALRGSYINAASLMSVIRFVGASGIVRSFGKFRRFAASNSVTNNAGFYAGSPYEEVMVRYKHVTTITTTYGTNHYTTYNNMAVNGLQSGDNYIGFRFGPSGGPYSLGWADLNLNLNTGVVTITDGAYNDVAGASIHIPDKGNAAPEPSSLALLALGAAGLAAFRRLKQRNAAAAA